MTIDQTLNHGRNETTRHQKIKKKNTQILEDNIFQFNFKQQITLIKYIQGAQISSLCFKQYETIFLRCR